MIDGTKNLLADQFTFSLLLGLAVFGGIMTAVAYAIWLERKISAWTQDRYGPNRVGPYGLLQPVADGLKFLLKEDIIPANVDRALFMLAPWMIFVVALVGFAIIPWGGEFRWPWMAADAARKSAKRLLPRLEKEQAEHSQERRRLRRLGAPELVRG